MPTKTLTVHYTSNGIPQTGLTPTVNIYELSSVSPTTNPLVVSNGATIEVGGGWYRYDFTGYTPNKTYVFTFDGGAGLADHDRYHVGGNESYAEETADATWDEASTDHQGTGTTGLILTQIKADVSSILISEVAMTTLLDTMLKYQRNRTKIDVTNAQLIIYDDDCTTPLTTFDLRDFSGMPSVQEVCERVPTTC